MRMILAAASLLALGGCTEPATQSVVTADNGFYDCSAGPAGGDNNREADRFVQLHRDPASGQLGLNFGSGRAQLLDPVAATGGNLFSNSSYAWRLGTDNAVLTDVENVRTYACRRVSDAAAQPAS